MTTNLTTVCPANGHPSSYLNTTTVANQIQCGIRIDWGGADLLRSCCDQDFHPVGETLLGQCFAVCASKSSISQRTEFENESRRISKCLAQVAQSRNMSATGLSIEYGFGCGWSPPSPPDKSGAEVGMKRGVSATSVVFFVMLLGNLLV